MPILNGDDINKINDFATKHGNEWLVIDKWGEGIRIAFKDDTAYLFIKEKGTFGSVGGWDFKNEQNKGNLGLQEEEVEEVEGDAEEEEEEEEQEEEESE